MYPKRKTDLTELTMEVDPTNFDVASIKPNKVNSDRFDIEARAEGGNTTPGQPFLSFNHS
jgi:hypothetical protein